MKTALLFSAGGLYGAWQVGVWQELHGRIDATIVVGASIGALNGWAVAGGCSPAELEERWLNLTAMSRLRWRVPRSPLKGFLDSSGIEKEIRELCASYSPRVDFGVVATDTLRMRPRLFRWPDVTWRHLAASVGMIAIFEQYRIGPRVYSDGGLLSAVPLWVAAEMGATRALVIDLLPRPPGNVARVFVGAMRMLSPFRAHVPDGIKVVRLTPPGLLGSPLQSLYWTRPNAQAWIRAGHDQASAIKHSIANCFERQ